MNTVKNPVAEVYAVWSEAIKAVVGENNYSMSSSSQIAKAPYARLLLMGNPGRAWDLEGNETATTPSFQVESFASGKKPLDMVYKIDSVSHQVLTDLGFRRTYGPELIENQEVAIKRVVSRYSRTYTGYFND